MFYIRKKGILKKFISFLGILIFISGIYSCDVGGGADSGVSVLVTASTEGIAFVTADIIAIYDENDNDICGDEGDKIVIPEEETIPVTFKLTPVAESFSPSSVRIEKARLEYIPKDDTYPVIPPLEINIPAVVLGETQVATVQLPVITEDIKRFFLLNDYTGIYHVKVTFYAVEINYDKSLKIHTDFTLDIRNRIGDDENECS